METRKEVIKQMGDEMKEDIFLEVNRRIHRNLRKRFWLKASAIAASIALLLGVSNYISYHEGYKPNGRDGKPDGHEVIDCFI